MSYVYAHKKCMLAECLANPGHLASSFPFPILLLLLLLLTTNVSENVLGVEDSYFPKIATVIYLVSHVPFGPCHSPSVWSGEWGASILREPAWAPTNRMWREWRYVHDF